MDRQPALLRESSASAPVAVARPALAAAAAGLADNRWTQLVLGIAAMVSIAGPQYVWTLFTGPLIRAADKRATDGCTPRLAIPTPSFAFKGTR